MIQMIWLMLSLVSLHSAIKNHFTKKKQKTKKKEGESFWVITTQYVIGLSHLIYMWLPDKFNQEPNKKRNN